MVALDLLENSCLGDNWLYCLCVQVHIKTYTHSRLFQQSPARCPVSVTSGLFAFCFHLGVCSGLCPGCVLERGNGSGGTQMGRGSESADNRCHVASGTRDELSMNQEQCRCSCHVYHEHLAFEGFVLFLIFAAECFCIGREKTDTEVSQLDWEGSAGKIL